MLKIQTNENHHKSVISTFCNLPHTRLILNSWGDVSMCCHQLTQLGRLDKDVELLDIWNSPLAKEIREVTDRGDLHHVCTSWNSCPYIVLKKQMFDSPVYKRYAYPLHIEICLPDKHCNVGGETPTEDNPACIMCRRNFSVPEQPDLTEFFCEKVRPLMPYLRYLSVLGTAEPFWKDAVFKIFDKLEFWRYKSRIEFITNTNGICLTEKVAKKFFEATTMSDLSWSIDAATPNTHRKLRRLDTFNLVTENLRRWIKMRDKYGGKEKHRVCIYNNINMINVDEMTLMVKQAKEWGVDKMVMLPTYDQAGVVQLGELMLCEKNLKVFKKAAEEAMDYANSVGYTLHYSKSFDSLPPSMEKLQAQNTESSKPTPLVSLDIPKRLNKSNPDV